MEYKWILTLLKEKIQRFLINKYIVEEKNHPHIDICDALVSTLTYILIRTHITQCSVFKFLYFKMHAYLKGRLYSCLKVDFTMRHIKK